MTAYPFQKIIQFSKNSSLPLYMQLAHCIMTAVEQGKLQRDDVVPSINELSSAFGISRDTAERGYKYLKAIGLLGGIRGKGCFVKSTEASRKKSILLLFNRLSSYKKIIYDSFSESLGAGADIDFFIYNNDYSLFKKILANCQTDYDHYVILPCFEDFTDEASKLVNSLPKEKLILIGRDLKGLTGNYGLVYEHFEKDIFNALREALPRLSNYHTINILFPEGNSYPEEILNGFRAFCRQYAFDYHVLPDLRGRDLQPQNVYITLPEGDLVALVEKAVNQKVQVGKQVGIISYNETPLKKIILNGITTISTDFKMMGEKAAQLIREGSVEKVEMKFSLNLRHSL